MIHEYDVSDAMRPVWRQSHLQTLDAAVTMALSSLRAGRRGGGHGSINAKYGTDPACCSTHVLTA